jgi:hypothetical protein
MSNSLRLALGALTCAPLVASIVLLVRALSWFARVAEGGGSVSEAVLREFLLESIGLGAGVAVLTVGLLAFYLYHLLVVRAGPDPENRLLWLLVLVGAGVLTMPIYWYLHLWAERGSDDPGPARSGTARARS